MEQARKLPAGAIAKGIDELPQRLAAANGNAAKVALDWKLIDGVKTRDEVRAMLRDVGFDTLGALIDATVPKDIRLERQLDLPEAKSEGEALGELIDALTTEHQAAQLAAQGAAA